MGMSRKRRVLATLLLLVGAVGSLVYFWSTPDEFAVIVPKGYDGKTPLTLVVWLHGWGGSPYDKQVQFQKVADKLHVGFVGVNGPVVTPATRYGWSDDFADNYLRVTAALAEASQHMRVRPGGTIALGFSQGAMVGVEAAVRHPDVFVGAITVSAGTGGTLPADRVASSAQRFVIVCGAKESPRSVQRSNDLAAWLRSGGAMVLQPDYPEHAVHTFPLDFAERLPDWLQIVADARKTP